MPNYRCRVKYHNKPEDHGIDQLHSKGYKNFTLPSASSLGLLPNTEDNEVMTVKQVMRWLAELKVSQVETKQQMVNFVDKILDTVLSDKDVDHKLNMQKLEVTDLTFSLTTIQFIRFSVTYSF